MALDLLAIVLALQPGEAAVRTAARLDWASRCVVLDPEGLSSGGPRSAAVSHVTTASAALSTASAEWVWLMTDRETVPPAAVAALRAAVSRAEAGLRVMVAEEGVGAAWTLRRPLVRLARAPGVRIGLDRRLEAVLLPAGTGRAVVPVTIARRHPDPVAEATRSLEAESRVLAALLEGRGGSATVRRAFAAGITAAWSVRTARRQHGRATDHTIAAVLAGYRAVLSYGRWWERAYAAGVVT